MTNKLYQLMNWPKIEEIIYSECDNPHELLGPHRAGKQTLVQAYFPGAEQAQIVFEGTGQRVELELADEDGFFAALLPQRALAAEIFVSEGERRSRLPLPGEREGRQRERPRRGIPLRASDYRERYGQVPKRHPLYHL